MSSCIFCKIIEGSIPSAKIYEDENVLAILDISQTTKGHALVFPKHHVCDIFNLSETDAENIFKVVPKLASAVKDAFNASGVNLVSNNGEMSGQTVPHYHIHIVPRYNEYDEFKIIYKNNMDSYSKEELDELANSIKSKL